MNSSPDVGMRATSEQSIELSIPAVPELLSLPRLVAAALSAREGFDIEAVEDIRLAIEELCLASFEGRGTGRLRILLTMHQDVLEVECTFTPSQDEPLDSTGRHELASDLTEQLLEALTDEHGSTEEGDVARAWFRKTRSGTPSE